MQNEDVDNAAAAILDGTAVDWNRLDSSDPDTRALSEQLKVLSAVARVHRAESTDLGHWGHLELLARVGAGAFGEVYRAWDTRLDREVALKLLRNDRRAGDSASPIINEGRLLARVRHPNVATIYGAESIGGRVGLWMEFVKGRTLEELLRSGHQFSRAEVVDIALELCRAVSAVHAAGVLHRDIKAQNVMRADDGRIVLMDFGTGRAQDDVAPSAAGTPLYLAPETLHGAAPTVQSDVYSIGVVFFRLLTGRYPVEAESLESLRKAHQDGKAPDIQSVRTDLSPAIAQIVTRALAAEPADRYQSADAMATDVMSLKQRLPTRRRWIVAAGIVVGVVALAAMSRGLWSATPARSRARTAIAVVPFKNLTGAPDNELIVDGLTYELIRNLSVIDGLEVRSATSAFALKGGNRQLADIGRALDVDLVLDGAVIESGGEWRVQAQLSRVNADTPLWTGKFDRNQHAMFAVVDDISLSVVNQLRLALGKGQRRYNLSDELSMLYLKARALIEQRETKSAEAALPLLEQVIARDPSFAPAYAGLSDAYAFMSQSLPDVLGLPHEQALVHMRAAATRAIELDPLLAEAHAAMGFLYSREMSWDEADRSFRRAIELNPGLTHVYTSYSLTTLLPMGRFAEDRQLLLEAMRRDPLSLPAQRELALLQLTSGDYTDAIRTVQRVRAIEPDYPATDLILGRALPLAGRPEEAMAAIWEPLKDQLGYQHWMALALVRAGRRDEVERMAAVEKHPYRLALFYTALGDKDRALEALAQAAEVAPHRTVRLLVYPELESLRSDPRFQAIRARFNLR